MNKKKFNIPVRGLKNVFENTHITFDGKGIEISISLNIKPEMKRYLDRDKVFKSEQFWVYVVKKHIPSKYIDCFVVQKIHDMLLNGGMIICRQAKIRALQRDIRRKKIIQAKQGTLCF